MTYRSLESDRVYQMARYERRIGEARDRLGGVCVVCGTTEDLQFDHVDPTSKSFTITMGWGSQEGKFWSEVEKCQLLCRPHHIEKTLTNGDNGKTYARHGTYYMYHYGCRCEECVRAGRAYNQAYQSTYTQNPRKFCSKCRKRTRQWTIFGGSVFCDDCKPG